MKAVLTSHIPEVTDAIRKAVEDSIAAGAMAVEAAAKQKAPVDTGYLRSSIQATKDGPMEWTVAVGAEYGVYVELGHVTRGGGHVGPRPFLAPAVAIVKPRLRAMIQTAIGGAT